MTSEPYTMGRWLVKSGQEAAFVAAWRDLGAYFPSLPHPPGIGTLVQSIDDARLFYSFGPWHSLEDIQAMRADPRTPGQLRRLIELCDEAAPGTFRWVATVGGKEEPILPYPRRAAGVTRWRRYAVQTAPRAEIGCRNPTRAVP